MPRFDMKKANVMALASVLTFAILLPFISQIPITTHAAWYGEPVPLPNENLTTNGTNFYVDGSKITINGVNDQTVFYIQYCYLVWGYPQYQYSNHLFDSETGCYNGDTDTHLASDNYTHFWWQYFYLLQSMDINAVRLGSFDYTTHTYIMDFYYNYKEYWDVVWDPMVAMAKEAGVYIIFCFGSGLELLDSESDEYDDWVLFFSDVMLEYANETAIAWWDIYNEAYIVGGSSQSYWTAHGGISAYISWRQTVSALAQLAAGDHLCISDSMPRYWGESYWDETYNDNFNASDLHLYGSAEDDYLIEYRKDWNDDLDRPLVFGESAINNKGEGYVPPYWWYWPWLADICNETEVSTIWMTLWDYPGYPVDPDFIEDIPPIPSGEEEEEPEIPAEESVITISADDTSGYAPLTVTFSCEIIPDLEVEKIYDWTLEDGVHSDEASPTHIYSTPGTYTVNLTVSGLESSNTLTITVSAPPGDEEMIEGGGTIESSPLVAAAGFLIVLLTIAVLVGRFI